MANRRETSFQIDPSVAVAGSVPDPDGQASAAPGTLRRRLSDVIADAAQLALKEGDLTSCEQLLDVMLAINERYIIKGGEERRNDPFIPQIVRQIGLRKQAKVYRGFGQQQQVFR